MARLTPATWVPCGPRHVVELDETLDEHAGRLDRQCKLVRRRKCDAASDSECPTAQLGRLTLQSPRTRARQGERGAAPVAREMPSALDKPMAHTRRYRRLATMQIAQPCGQDWNAMRGSA